MVHALHEIHRVLTPGGILIDARPDSRVLAYAERRREQGFQRFGRIRTLRIALELDRASDAAVSTVVGERLFRSLRRGRLWHRVEFASLAGLREYLREHLRFVHRAEWMVGAATRRRYSSDQFVIRRPVRYEVLSALKGDSSTRVPRRRRHRAASGALGLADLRGEL